MFVESVLCHGGLIDIRRVFFYLPWIFKLPIPEVWRIITPFLLTGGGFSFVFDLYFSGLTGITFFLQNCSDILYLVWTYGTGLELNSPRFSQPGDFFTYVVFVAIVILVSLLLGCHVVAFLTLALLSLISVSSLTHLEYLPAQSLLAEAVPEKRKITPCGTHIHVIRKSVKVSVCGVGMVGAQLRNAGATFPVCC